MLLANIFQRARLRSSREGASFDESRSRERSARTWSESAFRQCLVVACDWDTLAEHRAGRAPTPKIRRLANVNAFCSSSVLGCFPDAMRRLQFTDTQFARITGQSAGSRDCTLVRIARSGAGGQRHKQYCLPGTAQKSAAPARGHQMFLRSLMGRHRQ